MAGFGALLKEYDFNTTDMVRDPIRDVVYCTVPSKNSVVVIDSNTLDVVATIYTGSSPCGLDISPDGKMLYVANNGSTVQGIAKIDLESLTLTGYISTVGNTSDVAAGLNNTVYSRESSLRAYNAETGSQLAGSPSLFVYGGEILISPDRLTLYYYQQGLSPSSWSMINVSSWPGTVTASGQAGSNGSDMAMSADGQYLSFASGSPYSVKKFSAANPTVSYGEMDTGPYPRAVGFSADGNLFFACHTSGHLDVWSPNTYVKITEITTSGENYSLLTDRASRVLFAGNNSSTKSVLRAYYIGSDNPDASVNAEIQPAFEVRWDSRVGVLYQIQWRQAATGNLEWQNLGSPILGNGLKMSVFDRLRDMSKKFYRVIVVNP